MSSRSIRPYDVLHRIARVRASQASLALATATHAEQAASRVADQASSLCVDAQNARERCVRTGENLRLDEYWLLTELHESLLARQDTAMEALQEARDERSARALAAASMQRFADGVEDELQQRRHEWSLDMEGRRLADSLDVWMSGRELL